jgi:hypothetical protein
MIHVQTLDRKIWRKDLLAVYLHDCYNKNIDVIIDFYPEGSCAEFLRLYQLLDKFCADTGYAKNRITIKTANMLEAHSEYNIDKQPNYWYEVNEIQNWLKDKTLDIKYAPTKHFANFSSRSNWVRLWIATILDTYYKDKILQTYHYDPRRENYNANGYIGVDDLFRYGCDLIAEAAKFLQSCPRTLDIEYLRDLDNSKNSVYQHENSYYPIQHPSNLNLLQYYRDIFVDVVVEPNVSGKCFLVTEKLWRAILAKRPFIVVSNPNYLNNLKRLGFKTFDNYWDEEYDIHKEVNRIDKIKLILQEISSWALDELSNKLQDMESDLDHNLTVFKELTHDKINTTFGC